MPTPESVKLGFTIVAALLILAALVRPVFGVMGYTIIMVLRPGTVFPFVASIRLELLAGLFLIVLMSATGAVGQAFKVQDEEILKRFWWFLGVIVVSMLVAFDSSASREWVFEFLKVVIFLMMVVSFPSRRIDVVWLVWTVCLATSCISYDAIYNYMHGVMIDSTGGDRVDYAVASAGIGSGHVALANTLLQTLPLIWYAGICSTSRLKKLAGGMLFLLGMFGILVSGSRGGFVGLIGFFTLIAFFSKRRLLLGLVFAAVIVLAPVFMGGGYLNYMSTLKSLGTSEGAGSDRISGLRNGFEMLLRRPIFGVGPGCYPLARRAWMGWGLWAHNLYGELMGELGLAGVIVWPRYVYSYVRRSFALRRESGDEELQRIMLGIAVATFVRLIIGMGSHSLYSFFWYFTGGLVIAISRIEKSSLLTETGVTTNIR